MVVVYDDNGSVGDGGGGGGGGAVERVRGKDEEKKTIYSSPIS